MKLQAMLDGDPSVPATTGEVLDKVLEYLDHHRDEQMSTEPASNTGSQSAAHQPLIPSAWDAAFIAAMEQDTLFQVIITANYLDMKPLLDLGSKCVADRIKGMSPMDIRKMFSIVNEFTPEEEAQLDRETSFRAQ